MPEFLAARYAMSIAPRDASMLAARYLMPFMRTVEEVRRERLKQLRQEVGSLAVLNEKLGLNRRDSTLSQYLNEATGSKTSKPKVMGSPMARRLEQACGKEPGWMDTDPALLRVGEDAANYQVVPHSGSGSIFDALTEEEHRLLDNFRAMMDDDQLAVAEEVANKAAKMRAYTAKVLERLGANAKTPRTQADAKQTAVARAALDVTEQLRQRSLLDDQESAEK